MRENLICHDSGPQNMLLAMLFSHLHIPMHAFMRNFAQLVAALLLPLIPTAHLWAQELSAGCGVFYVAGRFGPYDYRADHYIPENTYKSHHLMLKLVEDAHFTSRVEANIGGKLGGNQSGPDLAYLLHAFPNHHRGLLSMIALGEKDHTDKPSGSPYVIECWLKRALAFRPDDHIVRLIYASYLVKKGGRNDEADAQLKLVANDPESNAITFRNVGFIYLEMKRYDDALKFAHKSIALGLAGGPLQEQLTAAGHWKELVVDGTRESKEP